MQGHTLFQQGNLQQAIDQFSLAIAADRTYFNSYDWRTSLYIELGYYELAIKDYDRLVRIGPKNSEAYGNRGYAYGQLGHYQRAIQDYDKAIQLYPNYSNAYFYRGLFLR